MKKNNVIKYYQLDNKNFEDFFYLLEKRGEKDKNYFRWKYLKQPIKERPRGFIAYKDEDPIGCIGIINREVQNESHETHYATWFADWFSTCNYFNISIIRSFNLKIGFSPIHIILKFIHVWHYTRFICKLRSDEIRTLF